MDVLLKESEALSLPCFDLVPAGKGDRVVAHWKGRRSDLPERFPKGVTAFKFQKHFLSVDQQIFDDLGLQGRGPLAGLYKLANAFCSPPPFFCRPKMPDPPKASVNRASVAVACFCQRDAPSQLPV